MEKKFFFFLLSLISLNIINNRNITRIPFKQYLTNIFFENQTHPLASKYMSQIVIELYIGTPPQKFNVSLNLNSFYSFFLNDEIQGIKLDSYYNKSSSETYNCTRAKKYYYKEDFDQAEIFTDTIYLSQPDEKNEFNFSFLLIEGLGYDVPNEFYTPGTIGLRLKNENNYFHIDENRFLYQLKQYNLSRTEVFYFDFDNNNNKNDNGYFVIGEDLFDDTDNFLQIKVGYLYNPTLLSEWSFNFDKVYYGNETIKESFDALIKTENGLIIGPSDYEEIIKEFFTNSTNCFYNHTKMGYATYKYYYCEKDFDENTMKDLRFELNSINFSFVFHGKELFFEENDKKYFKILFLYYSKNYYWYLGRDFLKKYRLRFDTDRKLIYIPLHNNSESKQKDNGIKKELFYEKLIFWIIIGLSIFIIGLIVFIIFCLKKYPRKKRTNEIEVDGDYDYKTQEEKEGIN